MTQFLRSLGPGLLFAGASIGVSHLIQSTRAGGLYGLAAFVPILLAMLIKYPAFLLGPLYTEVSGKTLLQGYREQGKWALAIVCLVVLPSMFSVIAALALLTSAFIMAAFSIEAPIIMVASVLVFCLSLLSIVGGVEGLKKIIKPIAALMGLGAIFITFASISRIDFSKATYSFNALLDFKNFPFLLALMGWMPAGMELPLLHSLWIQKKKQSHVESYFKKDFDFGYLFTLVFALCFVFVGLGVLFQMKAQLPGSPAGFSIGLLKVFSSIIGEAWIPLVSMGMIAILFSTLLAVADGFPRVIADLVPEIVPKKQSLIVTYFIQWLGAILVMSFFGDSIKAMIDVVTMISFLTAPVFAFLNHRCFYGLGEEAKVAMNEKFELFSKLGILMLIVFSLIFVISKVTKYWQG
ncbi:MAG: hypothetical protein VX642_13155 [Bdellovibrionota bacterium]|nr:hypothetical protein [Bdellovibrionota bacterium]